MSALYMFLPRIDSASCAGVHQRLIAPGGLKAGIVAITIAGILALSGCGKLLGIDDDVTFLPPPDAMNPPPDMDAGEQPIVDASPLIDAGPLCESWAAAHFDPCLLPEPAGPLDLSDATIYEYNTDDQTLIDTSDNSEIAHTSVVHTENGEDAIIVVVDGFTLGQNAALRAEGVPALMIASFSTIEIIGDLDVSADTLDRPAGARRDCANAPEDGFGDKPNDGDSGGGGGGGFGTVGSTGGTGGAGDEDNAGGAGGTAVAAPDTVIGGCRGGDGFGTPGGNGGDGGGAVLLSARRSVLVSGTIHTGGDGGMGGWRHFGNTGGCGGGGGGSGGLVELEGASVTATNTASMDANGAGGGEGGAVAVAFNLGQDGSDGKLGATPASGGSQGTLTGGTGGDGAAGAIDATDGDSSIDGGGGGGGGVGFIIVRSPAWMDKGAELSPAIERL